MTSVSKDMYTNKLDGIGKKYNNTIIATIDVKPVDVKLSTHIKPNENSNKKDPKFKVGDNVKI